MFITKINYLMVHSMFLLLNQNPLILMKQLYLVHLISIKINL